MESPYKELLIFVFGGGSITAVIALSKEIRERVAEKRKQKTEAERDRIQGSAEIQRLENESDEAAFRRLDAMLKTSQAEEERLRGELKTQREGSSISDLTKTQWYKCYRELGVKIDRIENQIIRELPHSALAEYLEDLRRKYDELGEKMP